MKGLIIFFILININIRAQEQIFVLCEGNFMSRNSSIWYLNDNDNLVEYGENPIGDTGQSLKVYGNKLYVVINGSGIVESYDINESGELSLDQSLSTNYSGPREIEIYNNIGFITEWYTNAILKIDIETFEIIGSITVNGLPEDMVIEDEVLYVSIMLDSEWQNTNKIISIDINTDEIINEYIVGMGPGQMIVNDDKLYISGIYYDENWITYSVTSMINLITQDILITDYGNNSLFGNDLTLINGEVYRTYNGGVIKLDENLNPIENTQIGWYNNVYSMKSYGDKIYFGLSDFVAPDQVIVMNLNGVEVANYTVGAIPGDFAFTYYSDCINNGDLNLDGSLDILDIVEIISIIIYAEGNATDESICIVDSNNDGSIDVVDVVYWISIILANH